MRCADYAIFGPQALSTAAMTALAGRKGCLLANHGLLVAGSDLDEALLRACELEDLCEQYWRASAADAGRNAPGAGSIFAVRPAIGCETNTGACGRMGFDSR